MNGGVRRRLVLNIKAAASLGFGQWNGLGTAVVIGPRLRRALALALTVDVRRAAVGNWRRLVVFGVCWSVAGGGRT